MSLSILRSNREWQHALEQLAGNHSAAAVVDPLYFWYFPVHTKTKAHTRDDDDEEKSDFWESIVSSSYHNIHDEEIILYG